VFVGFGVLPGLVLGVPLVSTNALGLIGLIIPVAIAVAILRYRLFDIDLVLNRTLVYGVLTVGVIGLYVLVVGLFGALFQSSGNLLVALLATGLAAILFQPVRERLQRGVNRLMYGERDDPYTVLSRLGQRLETTLAPGAGLPAIVETVAQALKLPFVAIALIKDEEFETVSSFGLPVDNSLILPLTYQGETIGQLICAPRAPGEEFSPADRRLLESIARQAGAVAHAVRLADDLQRSRVRLVTAREEERRRLRRDLHDGLGPQLASLILKADAARNLLPHDPDAAAALLVELKTQTQGAIADIRRLVYNLRPPPLDELGLVAALREHAAIHGTSDGLRVSIEAPETLPPLPAAVEVAAYRIALEALTNVARHAGAQTCAIRFILDGALQLEIVDDGRGVSPGVHAGVGWTSMRERAAELGGACEIGPAPNGGTRILARLPLPHAEE
jgi:signal transduction histidine kinase